MESCFCLSTTIRMIDDSPSRMKICLQIFHGNSYLLTYYYGSTSNYPEYGGGLLGTTDTFCEYAGALGCCVVVT